MGSSQSKLIETKCVENLRPVNAKKAAKFICVYWYKTEMEDLIFLDDISNIIIKYYDLYVAYDGKWIKENCGKYISVINDEKIKFSSSVAGYESAKLHTPIFMNQNSIYRWQIKFDTDRDNIMCYDIFGVVSDECDNIGKCAWGGLQDFYAISAHEGIVWKGTAMDIPDESLSTPWSSASKNDIITMELDCQSSELRFKIGDIQIDDTLQLPPRTAWYITAVHLSFGCRGVSVTFIKMDNNH